MDKWLACLVSNFLHHVRTCLPCYKRGKAGPSIFFSCLHPLPSSCPVSLFLNDLGDFSFFQPSPPNPPNAERLSNANHHRTRYGQVRVLYLLRHTSHPTRLCRPRSPPRLPPPIQHTPFLWPYLAPSHPIPSPRPHRRSSGPPACHPSGPPPEPSPPPGRPSSGGS